MLHKDMTAPLTRLEQLARYAQAFNQSQTVAFFGTRVSFPDELTARVDLDPVLPHHLGGMGTDAVNGGVLAALFDLAIGVTAALVDPTRRSATAQLSVSFMRAVRGARFHIIATTARQGDVLTFSTARLFDSTGVECAMASGLVRLSKQKWLDGESPPIN